MAERNPFARDSERRSEPAVGGMGSPGIGNRASQGAGDLADKAQEKAGEIQQKVKQQAVSGFSGQKSMAADSLHSVAEAIRTTGRQLREQDQGNVAEYADSAASQVERLSIYLRQNDVNNMVGEVERFARRQPAVFLGSAFLLGALGARFFKTSGQKRQGISTAGTRYGSPYGQTLSGLGTVSAGESAAEETPARGTVVPWPRAEEHGGETGTDQGQTGGAEG